MTLAFHHMGGDRWPAGPIVLELLARAVRSTANPPRLCLTVWSDQEPQTYENVSPLFDEVIMFPAGCRDGVVLTQTLRKAGVECFFSIPTGTAPLLDIPRILWVYDFQHVHHPQNFERTELERRERLFADNIQSTGTILVYSSGVAQDVASHYPWVAEKCIPLRFVPYLPPNLWESPPRGEPGWPEKYFLLMNQFHPYKNHQGVLQALAMLKAGKVHPLVVCTGRPEGEHAAWIMEQCKRLGVEEQFIVAGFLPRERLWNVLRLARALVNPSFFEGFGLGVAEARWLGVPQILSDLPVLREHDAPRVRYFDPGDSSELARLLSEVWQTSASNAGTLAMDRREYEAAQSDFGRRFLDLVVVSVQRYNARYA